MVPLAVERKGMLCRQGKRRLGTLLGRLPCATELVQDRDKIRLMAIFGDITFWTIVGRVPVGCG
jgi:hypothetical protein